jgi:hypothetical protein
MMPTRNPDQPFLDTVEARGAQIGFDFARRSRNADVGLRREEFRRAAAGAGGRAMPRGGPVGMRVVSARERHIAGTMDRIEARVQAHAEQRLHAQQHAETRAAEVEARLRSLENQYRAALSRGVAAKARYLALLGDRAATQPAIDRAYRNWQLLQLQRTAFASRMRTIENREREGG